MSDLQTALTSGNSLPKAQEISFSVYITEHAVELQPGIEQRNQAQLISSYDSYEAACDISALLAAENNLPLKDFALLFTLLEEPQQLDNPRIAPDRTS